MSSASLVGKYAKIKVYTEDSAPITNFKEILEVTAEGILFAKKGREGKSLKTFIPIIGGVLKRVDLVPEGKGAAKKKDKKEKKGKGKKKKNKE